MSGIKERCPRCRLLICDCPPELREIWRVKPSTEIKERAKLTARALREYGERGMTPLNAKGAISVANEIEALISELEGEEGNHFCLTEEEGWRPCPPSLCEADVLVQTLNELGKGLKMGGNIKLLNNNERGALNKFKEQKGQFRNEGGILSEAGREAATRDLDAYTPTYILDLIARLDWAEEKIKEDEDVQERYEELLSESGGVSSPPLSKPRRGMPSNDEVWGASHLGVRGDE